MTLPPYMPLTTGIRSIGRAPCGAAWILDWVHLDPRGTQELEARILPPYMPFTAGMRSIGRVPEWRRDLGMCFPWIRFLRDPVPAWIRFRFRFRFRFSFGSGSSCSMDPSRHRPGFEPVATSTRPVPPHTGYLQG